MQNFNFDSVKYPSVIEEDGTKLAVDNPTFLEATIDGQEMSVPLDPANRHYAEILKQVEAGTLTIQEAT